MSHLRLDITAGTPTTALFPCLGKALTQKAGSLTRPSRFLGANQFASRFSQDGQKGARQEEKETQGDGRELRFPWVEWNSLTETFILVALLGKEEEQPKTSFFQNKLEIDPGTHWSLQTIGVMSKGIAITRGFCSLAKDHISTWLLG